jgi:phosphomannomutase
MIAASGTSLYEMVEDLQKEVGPVVYERTDLRLKSPVSKEKMADMLVNDAPKSIGGENLVEVSTLDGVKYILADDSWLLIRPSGTEPVLRVYAEGRSQEMMKELLKYGEGIASRVA